MVIGKARLTLRLNFVSVGETVGMVIRLSAKYWSEWQDLNLRPPRPERGGPCLRPRADTVGQDRIALCREDEIPGNSLFLTDVAGPRYHHSRNLTARCDRLPNQRRQVSRDRYMGRAARVGAGLHDHGTNQFAQGLHDFGVLMRRGNVSPRPSMLVR